MPTDQVQLVVSAVKAAPLDYTVPAVAEIEPLSVYAEYDGSGAASAFLPTLEIISDSGHVVARSPMDTQVAAGGSANASWFPHVGAAAAAAPATTSQEMWPTFYTIPFESAAAFDDYNGALSGGWVWVIDALCKGNGYFHPAAAAVNKFFDFKLNLGPEYSVWTVTTMLTTGPNGGKATVRLLKLAEYDDQRPAGYWANPAGLTSEYIYGSGVFSGAIDTQDTYSAVLTRNVDYLSILFRIGAAPGTNAMTTPTLNTDADGYKLVSTGPGLYQVRVIVDSKNAASASYDYRPQVMTFSRTDGHGNA